MNSNSRLQAPNKEDVNRRYDSQDKIKRPSDPGEIQIRLTTTENEALVEVRDNGIGIPADKLERIFEQFYQVEDHLTRRYGGLGLGLSIARVLVNLHGGRIWAESEGPDMGAVFKVVLPKYEM